MAASRSRPAKWLTWGAFVLVAYGLATGCAAISVDGMLYQPKYGSFRLPTDGVRIKTPTGELSALYLPNPSARFTLWYFHGNAEDLGNIESRLRKLRDLGFSVFAYDYPGYGLSSGSPSEAGIYESTRVALDYLRKNHGITPEKLVVYGRSMGGGAAVDLATKEPVAGLILESAFTSVYRVMTHWKLLPFDQFENLKKIPSVRCPVLVIHGKEDHIVPFYHGEALYAAVKSKKEHLWVDLAGHNNIEVMAGEEFWNSVVAFSRTLEPAK